METAMAINLAGFRHDKMEEWYRAACAIDVVTGWPSVSYRGLEG
jgi:hypothetical protein